MADSATTVTKPRKYTFGGGSNASKLSSYADNLWTKSKEEFKGKSEQSKTHVVLEHKTFADTLSKVRQDASKTDASTSAEKPAFVFGQKLEERVVLPSRDTKVASGDSISQKAEDLLKSAAAEKHKTTLSDNGENGSEKSTIERLQEEAAQITKKEKKEEEERVGNVLASTSLAEHKTGEEDEEVLHRFQVKIHVFDREKSSWQERGPATLSLNKAVKEDTYRIVARASCTGTKKVIINSPIFSSMTIDKTDEKHVKITAVGVESTVPQIFLLTVNNTNADVGEQLHQALQDVLAAVKKVEEDSGLSRKRPADEEIVEKPLKKSNLEETKEESEDEKKEEESGKEE